jgi:hypothetical protein
VRRSRHLEAWAEDLYERYGARISEMVGVDDVPPIHVIVARNGPGAAWTSGTDVYLSARWFAAHPDDAGGCLHEFTHAVMRAPVYDDTTVWLIEGLADWVRDELGHDAAWTFAHFEPGKALAGYQTTAHFLTWLERRHLGVVRQLARRLSAGTYRPDDFEELTGAPLETLVTEYEGTQGR